MASIIARFPPSIREQIVAELNKARSNPRSYIPIVRAYGREYIRKYGGNRSMVTNAINEAVDYLQTVSPCEGTMTIDKGLSMVADVLVDIQSRSGDIGHGDFIRRAKSIGTYRSIAENIAYGPVDPQEIVAAWIVDIGVPTRGHRHNIYDPRCYQQVGVSYGPHPTYGNMIAVVFASGFRVRA